MNNKPILNSLLCVDNDLGKQSLHEITKSLLETKQTEWNLLNPPAASDDNWALWSTLVSRLPRTLTGIDMYPQFFTWNKILLIPKAVGPGGDVVLMQRILPLKDLDDDTTTFIIREFCTKVDGPAFNRPVHIVAIGSPKQHTFALCVDELFFFTSRPVSAIQGEKRLHIEEMQEDDKAETLDVEEEDEETKGTKEPI